MARTTVVTKHTTMTLCPDALQRKMLKYLESAKCGYPGAAFNLAREMFVLAEWLTLGGPRPKTWKRAFVKLPKYLATAGSNVVVDSHGGGPDAPDVRTLVAGVEKLLQWCHTDDASILADHL